MQDRNASAAVGNSPHVSADREAMRAEAAAIALAHPDVLSSVSTFWDGERIAPLHPVPPVVVQLPADVTCRDVELLIRHEPDGVHVDYREKSPHSWIPLHYVGGTFEVRPS
jgi:hypothetical protein